VIRLAVRVEREHAELVLAELLELVPAGVEEVELERGIVEYAVYGAPGELPALPALRAAAGEVAVEVSTSELPDDWAERWKRFHRPVLIEAPRSAPGGGDPVPALRVRPPWETAPVYADTRSGAADAAAAATTRGGGASPAADTAVGADTRGAVEIVIDPGQAFGTGAHATTRLCLELLLELAAREPPKGALLDVGTGSGVLAIAAARLGFAPVWGVDHERESIAAARRNAAANGVAIELRRLDLRSEPLPAMDAGGPAAAQAPVVAANLLRPLLLELARTLPRAPRHLIAGGMLVAELDEVTGAFGARLGLRELCRRRRGEWAAAWLSAP
jgi:ribosomal protein L11 methyltransferase